MGWLPLPATTVLAGYACWTVARLADLDADNALLTTVDAQLNDLQCYQHQPTHQATHDVLTGLANRALFEQRTRQLLTAADPFHVILLDLDDFKTVNDRLGHHLGDSLITEISSRLMRIWLDLGVEQGSSIWFTIPGPPA